MSKDPYLEAFVTEDDELSIFHSGEGRGILIPLTEAMRLAALVLAYGLDSTSDRLMEPETICGARLFDDNHEPTDEGTSP